jgi:hypothetical protein
MISEKVEAGELRERHRSSYSPIEEDLARGTVVMDGATLVVIDARLSRDAINKAPRAAGYRGSDFVRWRLAPFAGPIELTPAIEGGADSD